MHTLRVCVCVYLRDAYNIIPRSSLQLEREMIVIRLGTSCVRARDQYMVYIHERERETFKFPATFADVRYCLFSLFFFRYIEILLWLKKMQKYSRVTACLTFLGPQKYSDECARTYIHFSSSNAAATQSARATFREPIFELYNIRTTQTCHLRNTYTSLFRESYSLYI